MFGVVLAVGMPHAAVHAAQYFVTKLKEDLDGEASYDLLVLKELIGNMTVCGSPSLCVMS